LALPRRRAHVLQAPPQGLVYEVLQARVARAAQALKLGRHVIVEAQRRPHASMHIYTDALMSRRIACRRLPLPDIATQRDATVCPEPPKAQPAPPPQPLGNRPNL